MKLTNKQRIKLIASEIKLNPHNISKIKKMIKDASKDEINLNIRCYGGKTLFHYAVRYNTKGIISTLVKLGGNPNLCDDKFIAPLHYCVLKNCYHAAEELIKNKADINIPGEFEQTPLHLAVIKDNVELIKLFVDNGADITLVDEKNLTALDYAKDENNIDIIEFLEKEMKKISGKEIN